MKKIKFFSGLLAIVLCIVFTSCGDDEGDGKNGENAGTGNVFPEGTKKLSSIEDEYNYKTTFNYDGNKLVTVKDGTEQTITFTYSGNTVVMKSVYRNETETYTLNIGSNGFITDGTVEYVEEDGSKDRGSFTCKYNGDYLIAIETTGEYGYDNYKITWTDGNITKVVNEYKEDNYPAESRTYTSTYTTDANVAGLSFFEEAGVDVDELEYAYYAGLLGKPTKNLLKSNDDGDGYVFSYSYEFNADKYPTKITESESYNGNSSHSSFKTLTYK